MVSDLENKAIMCVTTKPRLQDDLATWKMSFERSDARLCNGITRQHEVLNIPVQIIWFRVNI